MQPEERNDRFQKILAPRDDVLTEVLLVVVVAPIDEDPADLEEAVKLLEAADASASLRHDEPRSDLVAGLVASPPNPIGLLDERDGEASFSVYETDHPATKLGQSFLLIVRTRHVVTMVNARSDVTR